MFYYQSMHNKNFEEKRQQKKYLSNPSPHLFLQIFSSSHTISIILYSNKHFFVKIFLFFFLSFLTRYIFFQQHIFILDRISSHIFFYQFSFDIQKYFSKKTNTTLILSNFHFLFKINYHPISRKKKNENYFFFVFFQKLKTHFWF